MSQLNTIVVSTRDMDRISQLMDNLATLSPELEKLEEELIAPLCSNLQRCQRMSSL